MRPVDQYIYCQRPSLQLGPLLDSTVCSWHCTRSSLRVLLDDFALPSTPVNRMSLSLSEKLAHSEPDSRSALILDLNNPRTKSYEEKDANDSPLPTPVSAQSPRPGKWRLSAAMIIPIWIVLSSTVILYNNYLFNELGFKYPVFTVTWHLTFAVRLILILSLR
jgi:hypothetical protein